MLIHIQQLKAIRARTMDNREAIALDLAIIALKRQFIHETKRKASNERN